MSQSKTWNIQFAEKVDSGDLGAILELISGLQESGDTAMLHLAANQLESKAVVRVADLAANALIKKLDLKPSFAAKTTGYTAAELAEIHQMIMSSIPQ